MSPTLNLIFLTLLQLCWKTLCDIFLLHRTQGNKKSHQIHPDLSLNTTKLFRAALYYIITLTPWVLALYTAISRTPSSNLVLQNPVSHSPPVKGGWGHGHQTFQRYEVFISRSWYPLDCLSPPPIKSACSTRGVSHFTKALSESCIDGPLPWTMLLCLNLSRRRIKVLLGALGMADELDIDLFAAWSCS